MNSRISSPKDFWAGLIYVAFGAALIWLGQGYKFGTAGRMGPGYFPLVLAAILVGIGSISLIRSFFAKGEPVSEILWKPMFFILLGCALFGFLLNRAGLIAALLALCLVSAAGSREFRFDWKATGGLLILVTFCALVFVKGLGVPMPIIGPWLEPVFGPIFYPLGAVFDDAMRALRSLISR